MPRIRVAGGQLYAGVRPWRAWGFNWGLGERYPILTYFDEPSPDRLAALSAELDTAVSLGANSMRIYLELGQVMERPAEVRASTLAALRSLLEVAENRGVYLDITGNVVWRPAEVPAWYDELPERNRWEVQARFWGAVAAAAAESPAVLCYELTSEPIVAETPGYYTGELAGFTFVQSIATRRGRSGRRLARAWTRQLASAVRAHDDRPVTIGLLPSLHHGAFTPAGVSDLLDLLVVHEYPRRGFAELSVALVRGFAAFEKPLLLGETFIGEAAPLLNDAPTLEAFLVGANPYLAGVFEFFDGRDPDHMTPSSTADVLYQRALRQFMALRPTLLEPRILASPTQLSATPEADIEQLAAARTYLRTADPVMRRLIDSQPDFQPRAWLGELPQMDAFGVLIFQIVGQQLSVLATKRLLSRVEDGFGGRLPSPEAVLAADPGLLRKAGLSRRKVETIRAVAREFAERGLSYETLQAMSDDEIERRLTAIPGVGPWTVHGFLIIALDRQDVVLPGDLVLRKAIQRAYGLDHLPRQDEVLELAERWRPHRSLASSYLFATLED